MARSRKLRTGMGLAGAIGLLIAGTYAPGAPSNDLPARNSSSGAPAAASPTSGTEGNGPRKEGETTEVSSLSQRVLSRWQALRDGEYQRAYEFELPSYRALYGVQDFASAVGAGPAAPREVKIQNIEIEAPRALVALELESTVPLPPPAFGSPMFVSLQERWLYRDGEWWHVPAFGTDLEASSVTQAAAGREETEDAHAE